MADVPVALRSLTRDLYRGCADGEVLVKDSTDPSGVAPAELDGGGSLPQPLDVGDSPQWGGIGIGTAGVADGITGDGVASTIAGFVQAAIPTIYTDTLWPLNGAVLTIAGEVLIDASPLTVGGALAANGSVTIQDLPADAGQSWFLKIDENGLVSSSATPGNPFDQSLNAADTPTFALMTLGNLNSAAAADFTLDGAQSVSLQNAAGSSLGLLANGTVGLEAAGSLSLTAAGNIGLAPTGDLIINGTPGYTGDIVFPGVGTLGITKGIATAWTPE